MAKKNSPTAAFIDFIVLSLILAAVNYLISKSDLGWFNLNPTPWLLPIVLIGVRYGFACGLTSGLLTAALLALTVQQTHSTPLVESLREHVSFYLALVIAGAVSGEFGAQVKRRSEASIKEQQSLKDEVSRLRSQLDVVLETRHDLQQQLALFNAPVCALDEELKTLFTYSQDEFVGQLLRLLHRLTNVTSAAIYFIGEDRFEQIASVHPTPQLASSLFFSEAPLAESAISSGQLASVPDATELTTEQPFLAALPWLDHLGRAAVLIIHDMPLESFNMNNLARVELILTWASAMAVLRQTFTSANGSNRSISKEDFMVLLDEAVKVEAMHGIPSSILRFDLPPTGDVRALALKLPLTAVVTRESLENSIVVLLPFTGETEANELTRHLVASMVGLRGFHYLITSPVTSQALWEQIMRP